jgi:hypothetical protein
MDDLRDGHSDARLVFTSLGRAQVCPRVDILSDIFIMEHDTARVGCHAKRLRAH